MAAKREKIHFETVEELLGAPVTKDATTEIRIDQIYPFVNHPFKVVDDDKMSDLVQSIRDNGVIVPVLVRPDDEGTYEMISGHRRMHAAKLAGLATIPAIIKPMTNDEATIAMVDANMQREEILPSERAFSLKMKIRIVCISPGVTDTDLGRTELQNPETQAILRYTGLERPAKEEEIGFLASTVVDERNGYLTGTDIFADGGCTAAGFGMLAALRKNSYPKERGIV
jgi:hypothetical protein